MQESKSASPLVNKKNIFSQFVYQTNNKLRRGFKSGSFVEPSLEENKKDISIQTNFRSQTEVNENKKVEICKETCTQTSRTILALVEEMKAGKLSPDSLSPKRRTPRREIDEEEYWLDSEASCVLSEKQLGSLSYNRKSNVEQYLDSQLSKKTLLTGNSLTKTFLDKRNQNKSTPPVNVQKLFRHPKTSFESDSVTLKSQSYVDPPRSQMTCPSTVSGTIEPRFKVKSVIEKYPEDKTKPVRYFCQSHVPSKVSEPDSCPARSRKSMSFMSPTISSENKDQSKEIKCLEKLISPTRRGRSASPKKTQGEEVKTAKKVPYIDRSEESIEPSTAIISKAPFTGRINDAEIHPQGSDEKITSTRSVQKYDDNNSQLHLDLRLSCEDLTNSTVVGGSITSSVTSTESILCQALAKLRDQDWSVALRGLAEIVEMCRVLDADFAYPHMTGINQRLIELMKSPRSHVTRTACQAVGHLFEFVKDTRRPEFDEIVDTLLCRTADANKFIRHDANLALDCMVTHIPTFHAVRALTTKGPEHKNPLVRMATARLIVCSVVIAGPQNLLHPNSNEFTRKRIILNLVKFLEDKDIATRKFGERLYKLFYKDRIFEVYLKRYLERDVIMKIKKCIRSCNGDKL